MKIVFLMPQGVIEWTVPEDQQAGFSFPHFIANIRLNGHFIAPGLYLRHDAMIGIVNDPGAMKPFQGFSREGTLQ